MSENAFLLLQDMDLENVETQIVMQCAPVIAGLKISNLLIVGNHNREHVKTILKKTGLCWKELLNLNNQTTFLVYQSEKLKEYLMQQNVQDLMKRLGYQSCTQQELVENVQKKYRDYMVYRGAFPHEMGLLLGYPAEDVYGFIENDGKNFLFSGYWKVYENMPAKKKLFMKFEQARETMLQLISCGISIIDVIDIYKEEPLRKAVG